MIRLVVIGSILVFVIMVGGGILLYLAYGLTDGSPRTVRVAGLSDSTRVEFYSDGSTRIRAENEDDAYAALGYVHAQEHGWTMALYRRSAVGRLSEWLGDDLLELDRLALRLGLSRGAREAYGALSRRQRDILAAYARGVNAAFGRQSELMRHEFIALAVEPEEWEPWHALAVERLVAWMAAERPDADTLRTLGGDVASFFDADDVLRRLLHLHGFENGLAWTMRDSSGVHLVQRHVYGATALPFYHTVHMEWPGQSALSGGTLIGTPFIPAGTQGGRSWAVLLSSALSLQRAVRDTSLLAPIYERLIGAEGEEHLVRIDRSDADIFFAAPRAFFTGVVGTRRGDAARAGERPAQTSVDAPAQATGEGSVQIFDDIADAGAAALPREHGVEQGWVLRWSGFLTGSDAEAWDAIALGLEPTFRLFGGDGIELARDGGGRILGQPRVVRDFAGGTLVSNSTWSTFVGGRLDTLVQNPAGLGELTEFIDDAGSAWAAHLAPSLVESAIAVPNQPAIVTETLAYLRNWDFAYDQPSIAASIFDTWTRAYRDSIGILPHPAVPDSAQTETLLLYELLVEAVERLAADYGENLSQWRWEDVQPHRFHFPVFSADTLVAADFDRLPRTRYASIEVPGAGHPSSLLWGPSFVESSVPSPARWEASVSSGEEDVLRVRSRRFRPNRFFGRYLVSDRTPAASRAAAPDLLTHSTYLLPLHD